MREMGLVLALLTISTPAAAQWSAVEFGLDIGRACIGESSGFCGDEIRANVGHACKRLG